MKFNKSSVTDRHTIYTNTLGHGFLILCLSKLSRGYFEQSVGRGNKEKIKKHNFFYSSWRPQRAGGRPE